MNKQIFKLHAHPHKPLQIEYLLTGLVPSNNQSALRIRCIAKEIREKRALCVKIIRFDLSIKKKQTNKKPETELTAGVLKKKEERPKPYKRLKRTLFNWTKQDETCKFSRKSSFSSYVQHKNFFSSSVFIL